jgi:hypothetical protein
MCAKITYDAEAARASTPPGTAAAVVKDEPPLVRSLAVLALQSDDEPMRRLLRYATMRDGMPHRSSLSNSLAGGGACVADSEEEQEHANECGVNEGFYHVKNCYARPGQESLQQPVADICQAGRLTYAQPRTHPRFAN